MRTLVALLAMTAAAWAQNRNGNGQDYPKPERGPQLGAPGKPPEVSIRGGLEFAYDDNIIELSEKQLSEFEDGTKPQKYRIKEEDDLITSPWAEIRLKAWIFQQPTRFALKAQANAYQENSFANYEKYSFSARQDLGRHEAGLEYDLEADAYHREFEIVVPGPNLWDSGFYTEHEAQAYYLHDVGFGASVKGFAGLGIRDYESPFGYRSLRGFFLGVRPGYEAEPVSFFLQYRYVEMESEADASEIDTSYREHQVEPGAAVTLLGKRLELSLRHRWGFREYTTSNSPLVDPSHVDREDVRRRLILEARYKLHKNWSVEGKYIRRSDDSDRPFDTGVANEDVGSEQNVFVLGVTFAF